MNNLNELLAMRAESGIGKIERDTIRMTVHGGMCELEFVPGFNCGPARPGVSFTLISETDRRMHLVCGKWHAGMGCFTLADAIRLRDMLDKFIKEQQP